MKKLTVGSCFSGIGGIELGLERTGGFETKWQIENDPYASAVLKKHWPNVVRYTDIKSVDVQSLERIDLICGGDPCQENSATNQTGRSRHPSLGGEFIAIIDACRPRLVLRENPSVTNPNAPWPWWRFRAELERLGYAVLPIRIRACCLGADHRRERVFLLGELPDAIGIRGNGRGATCQETKRRWSYPETTGRPRWAAEPGIRGVAHGVPSRVDRLRCLGNAVVPQVAEKVGRMILENLRTASATAPKLP